MIYVSCLIAQHAKVTNGSATFDYVGICTHFNFLDVDSHPVYPVGDTWRVSGMAHYSDMYSYIQTVSFPRNEDADPNDSPVDTVEASLPISRANALVHDHCWKLLCRFFKDVPILWGRLVDTLRLKPNCGLRQIREAHQAKRTRVWPIGKVHHRRRERYDRNKHLTTHRKAMVLTPTDVFTVFPPEICLEIAQQISMPDFYNLRLVSRYMGNLFFSMSFWASQFDIGGSRGWLHELKEGSLKNRPRGEDWHLLYWCSSSIVGVQREVWECCRWIKDMVAMTSHLQMPDSSQFRTMANDCVWKISKTDFFKRYPAKKPLHSIDIPRELTTIVISVITVHTIRSKPFTFVTGLRFLSKEDVISVGYILPDSAIIPIRSVFQGFELAQDASGIVALKVIVDNVSSSWFGEAREGCEYTTLMFPGQPLIMRASFSVSPPSSQLL